MGTGNNDLGQLNIFLIKPIAKKSMMTSEVLHKVVEIIILLENIQIKTYVVIVSVGKSVTG